MHVLHISVECYPIAKAGGLADVVGALPIYLNRKNCLASVVMPKYDRPWVHEHEFEEVHRGVTNSGTLRFEYAIIKEKNDTLGFPLYMVDIPQFWYRPGVYTDPHSGYGYWDEFERYASFQVAVLDWLKSWATKPDIIHCHDHHTAFIPLLMHSSPQFHEFERIPSVLTIHNGQYHGWYYEDKVERLPKLYDHKIGFLFWRDKVNALSAGIRACWKLTTVSKTYMYELLEDSNGLESLISHEMVKSQGILNGIDTEVWNPATDPYLIKNYSKRNLHKGKSENKIALCEKAGFDPDLPLFIYIGRLAREKGADLLPDLIGKFLDSGNRANFMILGTGDQELHHRFDNMNRTFLSYFDARLDFNEGLAHQMYAGADFLLMPSRVEPCGLNQMYALRYGTIPVVRKTGGLKDSVRDVGDEGGYGITFQNFTLEDAEHALYRAMKIYFDKKALKNLQSTAISLDFSWQLSAENYLSLYQNLIHHEH